MIQEKRIPLARTVRWQRLRLQAMPVLSFLLSVVAVSWLWRQYGSIAQGVGEVDSPRVEVTSPTAGLVLSLPHLARKQWKIYDHVQAGDVIARIEDQQLESRNMLLRQEIVRVLAQLSQHQIDAANDKGNTPANDAARRAWQYEQTKMLSLDARLTSGSSFAAEEKSEQVAEIPELPEDASVNAREALARLRQTRHALEVRAKDINNPTQSLEIQSPIDGTLVAVYCSPGQTVPPGGRIATIAADYGRHIVGYIPEGVSLDVRPGMRVTLRARVAGAPRITSEVEQLGRRIERIPSHEIASSKTPQWGTPVRIKMPSEVLLQPGALVDVLFEGSARQ